MKINILGYGVMGKQIASLFFFGGFDVIVWNNECIKEEELRRSVIASGKAISRKSSPFKSVQSLADFFEELLKEE